MQVFFAVSCVLAVLALSNGASIVPSLDREIDQPRALAEAQDAVVPASEVRQVAETVGQSRAVELHVDARTSDGAAVELKSAAVDETQPATDETTSVHEETDGAVREKRTLLLRHLLKKRCRGGCSGLGGCGLGCEPLNPCLQLGGCGSVCGIASPCSPPTNVVVVPRPVPVAQPVPVPVPIVKVVRHPVPVPQLVPVPVTKLVPVPVPVEPLQPCCSQPQPCCGQAPLPCSPCSG